MSQHIAKEKNFCVHVISITISRNLKFGVIICQISQKSNAHKNVINDSRTFGMKKKNTKSA